MSEARIAGLVLAAGAGRRLGTPKAPVVVAGERLVDRAVRTLREGGCDPIHVVLGAWVGEVPGATVAVNPAWTSGMASSLRSGIDAVRERVPQASAVAITLVDLPDLTPAAVQRVVSVAAGSTSGPEGALVSAVFDGVRGHPVVVGREHWDPLLAVVGADSGARDYLRRRVVTEVEVGDVAGIADIDTVEDLANVTARDCER